jgi:type II secretory pathway component PulC
MRSLLWPGLAVVLGACAASRSPAVGAPPATAPAPPPSASAPDVPASGPAGNTLSRSSVRAAVARGLGAFLQHVEFDDRPVFVGGKFHGFRIAALHDDSFFRGVDLKPGDVVTGVNGFPIERPEQAESVFESLQVASELRVAYERDGHARELVFTIVEDR